MTPERAFWCGKRVCVIGGTGFLGYQIVKDLIRLGARVRVLALPPKAAHPILKTESVDCCFGDVGDRALVAQAMADREVVFYAAGEVALWGAARRRLRDVHMIGAENLLEYAKAGSRLVHTSSVVTIGASQGQPLTESSSWNLARLRVDYVQAKRAAEGAMLRAVGAGRDVVVVNPSYLIGPEDFVPSVVGRFLVRFWKGRIPMAPSGGLNLVDVRDAAVGHLLAAERGRTGQRYILCGENITFVDLQRQMAQIAGLKPRAIKKIPLWVEWLLAAAAELRAGWRGREPFLCLQHVRLHHFTWFYDGQLARQELEFFPRPLEESLRDTYLWHFGQEPIQMRGFQRFWMRPGRPKY